MQRSAQEFFEWRDHQRTDAELHEPILAEGDDDAARQVSAAVMRRLGFKEDRIASLTRKHARRYEGRAVSVVVVQREAAKVEAQPSLADVLPQIADLISKSVTEALAVHAQATRDLIAGMHKADQKNMERLITAITAPKKIVHDDDGRPVGLESDHGE